MVVVAALAAPRDPALDELLGEAGAQALRGELQARARRWAAAVAPERAYEANTFGAAAAAVAGHGGPLLFVSPDVPGLSERHAQDALADLADGLAVAIAPAMDGLPYLLAFARADDDLVHVADASLEEFVAEIRRREGGLGMLRAERRLSSAADARALAADPMAPPELLAHLAAALDVRAQREH